MTFHDHAEPQGQPASAEGRVPQMVRIIYEKPGKPDRQLSNGADTGSNVAAGTLNQPRSLVQFWLRQHLCKTGTRGWWGVANYGVLSLARSQLLRLSNPAHLSY